jgi:transposase-like protein
MSGRTTYSDTDRATVLTSLQINDGNIKRTARETGIPISTVRNWKATWDTDGIPDTVAEAQVVTLDAFVNEATEVRNMLLARMRDLAPESKNLREVATALGILDDKIVRAKGQPTQRTEHVQGLLPSPDEFRAALGGWMQGVLDAQNTRDRDFIEADAVVVEPVKALPR